MCADSLALEDDDHVALQDEDQVVHTHGNPLFHYDAYALSFSHAFGDKYALNNSDSTDAFADPIWHAIDDSNNDCDQDAISHVNLPVRLSLR